MKCNKTYSLNVEVVKAFEEEVDKGQWGRVIEAMMIQFLIKYAREKSPDIPPPITTKEVS